MADPPWRSRLQSGLVIPACPLTLDEDGSWSQRHQRAVVRYYLDAGAGGIAVGVHSTQFAIRDPAHALFEPILRLVAEEFDRFENRGDSPSPVRIAGLCGRSEQAIAEAQLVKRLGYHAGLLSLMAVSGDSESQVLDHCRRVADELPLIGFYLQPAVGGRVYSYDFWRRFCEIESLVAIKIAPFNRYQTLDVVRAVVESGRDDISLYSGNDDNIIVDLLTEFEFAGNRRRIVGGLLGQWGVWTRAAVDLLDRIKQAREHTQIDAAWLTQNAALTDANAAVFDAANGFAGCIPGIMEVLRRQGLAPSCRCLNPEETLSPGQAAELDRVTQQYGWLIDDRYVSQHLATWLTDPTKSRSDEMH